VSDWLAAFERDGFVVLPGVFDPPAVASAIHAVETALRAHAADAAVLAGSGPAYGARNLLRLWPAAIDLARHPPLADALLAVLGPDGGVIRGLYFDKPPGHSWALPWHKDYTVAVKAHDRLGVFLKPTLKAGVPHVEAPEPLLRRMVTARVHLDDMTPDNGPLRVIPGSHVGGDDRPPVTITGRAGDVLLMRPLLTHGSGHSTPATAQHRRIVHLECSPSPHLPDGYEWHDFRPITFSASSPFPPGDRPEGPSWPA
jgi:hypothetical protein